MSAVSTDTSLQSSYVAQTSAATTSASENATAALTSDFETFLKILTTQLQNQDPTSPMDASEFTQQLVQYSQVEQLIQTNNNLEGIQSTLNSNGITPLLSYVGQYVESSTTGDLVVQGGQALLAYNLPSEASSVVLSVRDSEGDVIAQIDGTTNSGLNRVAWDGSLDAGGTAEDGVYSFILTAKDSSGNLVKTSDMRIIGKVSSIETDEDGKVTLMVGDMAIDDEDILSVFSAIGTTSSQTSSDTASTDSSSTEESSSS